LNGEWNLVICVVTLQADILDVNEIFRDLGMLVHEQGEVVGKLYFSSVLYFLYISFASYYM